MEYRVSLTAHRTYARLRLKQRERRNIPAYIVILAIVLAVYRCIQQANRLIIYDSVVCE